MPEQGQALAGFPVRHYSDVMAGVFYFNVGPYDDRKGEIPSLGCSVLLPTE